MSTETPIEEQVYDSELHYINVSFALSCLLLAFCVTGTITNFISIVVYSHPAMRSSINILLTGLSITDLCLCVFAVPTFVFPSFCLYIGSVNGNSDNLLCTLTTYSTLYVYPLTTMTQTCSVWTFVVITFERWVAVCYPFKARWASTGRSLRALAVVCSTAAAYNLIRFFEYTPPKLTRTLIHVSFNASMNASETYEYRSLVEEFLRKDENYMKIYYSGLYLVTHFLIPFTVLAGINGRMIYSIHRARQQRRMLSNTEKKEHRTALMMGLVVLMFLCCNTLTFVLNFAEQLDRNLFLYRTTKILMFTLNDVSNLLVLLNASATFGFYYACSQKYRHLLHYYLVNFWCNPCISLACPYDYESNRSRLGHSKMAFSFHSAISLHVPSAEPPNSASPRTVGSNSRRCSSIERGNNNRTEKGSSTVALSDEKKRLISNSYLSPSRSNTGRRWSSVTLTPPDTKNRLTVPSQHIPHCDSIRRCSNMGIRSSRALLS